MTTIAYRGGILAADTLVIDGNARVALTDKIVKSPAGCLAGAAGEMTQCHAFLEWFENCLPGSHPPLVDHSRCDPDGVVIDTSGQVFLWGGAPALTPVHFEPEFEFIALGSGAKYALGAMWQGATAEQAVKVAAMFDIYTGGRIVTLRLSSSPPDSSRKPS